MFLSVFVFLCVQAREGVWRLTPDRGSATLVGVLLCGRAYARVCVCVCVCILTTIGRGGKQGAACGGAVCANGCVCKWLWGSVCKWLCV